MIKQHIIKIYYKHPQSLLFDVCQHKYWLIAWIKALWRTKFGWNFFNFQYSIKRSDINFNDFRSEILDFAIKKCPTEWRRGQAVFNYINQNYHVARQVQFEDGIDCFYNDDKIEPFIIASYRKLCGGF